MTMLYQKKKEKKKQETKTKALEIFLQGPGNCWNVSTLIHKYPKTC